MKRLILFRHAKTERHAPSGQDFDRRLTQRGRDDARLMGQVLADAGFSPDLVLVSEAVRAQETWEEAKTAFPDARCTRRRELYTADAQGILAIARKHAEDSVMVVAHNPAIHALSALLLEQSGAGALHARVHEGFPTAAVAVFDMNDAAPRALGLFTPKDHGGGSGDD